MGAMEFIFEAKRDICYADTSGRVLGDGRGHYSSSVTHVPRPGTRGGNEQQS